MTTSLESHLAARKRQIDAALNGYLPRASANPTTLHKAMRHSMFAGGKRLRPILTLAGAEACGGGADNALAPACAVECVHTYSLIHDDLPCMDDDDFRRGHPTCHKAFGEAIAVLAGDALLSLAFEIAAASEAPRRYTAADFVTSLAVNSGSRNLIAGQVMDLEGEGAELSSSQLKSIHRSKTSALLATAVSFGGMSAGCTPRQLDALAAFGESLGLAFQIVDDILDVTQTTETLGKSTGKDEATHKATYPAIIGLEASRREAARLTRRASAALSGFGRKADTLRAIADHMLAREF
jgi:geranylgeranyl diphosphate synthase type II